MKRRGEVEERWKKGGRKVEGEVEEVVEERRSS